MARTVLAIVGAGLPWFFHRPELLAIGYVYGALVGAPPEPPPRLRALVAAIRSVF